MSKKDKKNAITEEYINDLISERKRLTQKTSALKDEIFNLETTYLEFTQGQPLIQSLEGYLTMKNTPKKYTIKDCDRIFTREFREDK